MSGNLKAAAVSKKVRGRAHLTSLRALRRRKQGNLLLLAWQKSWPWLADNSKCGGV